jgi:hypothetical protein
MTRSDQAAKISGCSESVYVPGSPEKLLERSLEGLTSFQRGLMRVIVKYRSEGLRSPLHGLQIRAQKITYFLHQG